MYVRDTSVNLQFNNVIESCDGILHLKIKVFVFTEFFSQYVLYVVTNFLMPLRMLDFESDESRYDC